MGLGDSIEILGMHSQESQGALSISSKQNKKAAHLLREERKQKQPSAP